MIATRLSVLALAALALAGCQDPAATSVARPAALDAQNHYVHVGSGMRFPAAVNDYQRGEIMRFDAAGLDVGVNYLRRREADASVVATVYIYPAPALVTIGSPADVVATARDRLCRNEFGRRKRELVAFHPQARLLEECDARAPESLPPVPGRMAVYEFEEPFAGRSQLLRSELWVFCYVTPKWAIQYRFTSPKSAEAESAIRDFMTTLPWSVSTDRI